MELMRQVVVFDARDLAAESAFWAGMLGGRVFTDERWHSVFDSEGRWRIGIQLAPNHIPPDWPDGEAQQVHLDLHVSDPLEAHAHAMALGARLLKDGDTNASEGHRVYADPAGHPFCIGWGQPHHEAVRAFLSSVNGV